MSTQCPPLVNSDPAAPHNSHPSLPNLVNSMRWHMGLRDWLMESDLTTVLETWWFAQEFKARLTEIEHAQRAARAHAQEVTP